MKIAIARLHAPVDSASEAINRICKVYDQAVSAGANLVVLPEITLPNTSGSLLQPGDIMSLAPRIGPVPLLVGSKTDSQYLHRFGSAVFSLASGRITSTGVDNHPLLRVKPTLHAVSPQIHSNHWNGPEDFTEGYRLANLIEYGVPLVIPFFRQPCRETGITEQFPAPERLSLYWHRLQRCSDPVSDSGCLWPEMFAVQTDACRRKADWGLVDLARLWPEIFDPRSPQADSTLVLGCATCLPLRVGNAELSVEIPRTWLQFRTGLMYRHQLTENQGMLLTCPNPKRVAIDTKNIRIPLSCAFLDSAGIIEEIQDLLPFALDVARSRSNRIRFVLKVNRGWFPRHGVGIGALAFPLRHWW